MRRAKPSEKRFDITLFLGMLAIMIAVVTLSYVLAESKIREEREIYTEKIRVVTAQAKRFADNISTALTYLDTAREDLKNAKLSIDKAVFWLDEKNYQEMKNRSFDARFYFNRSNYVFEKALYYLLLSMNSSTEEYEMILQYYINYTNAAVNLTNYGKIMSLCLENASIHYLENDERKADQEMVKFGELTSSYTLFDQEMEDHMRKIKLYYGIRE